MIRRGRYPDFKGRLPFIPGYQIVGVVEKIGSGVTAQLEGQMVADLCVVGGYVQYAILSLPKTRRGVETCHAVQCKRSAAP
jgi:NADPH:quinone reductase-like Zn-dependent oxidoreductase